MKHTANWVSLDRTINDFIAQAELTTARYLKLWQIGIRALEELGMDVTDAPVTRKLAVDPNTKTVELPVDYVQWVKVGVLNANGEVATLRRNINLSKYGAIDNDRVTINTDGGQPDVYFRNYQEGDQYFNLFGAPSGTLTLGQFDVDDVQGVILLDDNFAYDYCILEYLASAISDKTYLFPIQARETVIAFLDLMNEISLPQGRRSNNQRIQMKEARYNRLKGLAKRRISPLRLSEANDVLRLNNRLTLKA